MTIPQLLVNLLIIGGPSAAAADSYQPLVGTATAATATQTAANVDSHATDLAALADQPASAIDPATGTTYELATFATLPASSAATITEVSPTQYTIANAQIGSTVCLTSSGTMGVCGTVTVGAC